MPTPAAQRMALYRDRRARGATIVRVEVGQEAVRALLNAGRLDYRLDGDDNAQIDKVDVSEAVSVLIRDWAHNGMSQH